MGRNCMMSMMFAGMLVIAFTTESSAERNDIGYRKIMLGGSREEVRKIVKSSFGTEYAISDEGDGAMVLTRTLIDNKPIVLIELKFDQSNVLYKINVKIKKITGNPVPDEVVKVIEDKYGKPSKRTITNALDLIAYWYLDNDRYEIFFHNIASWDKFDVQYTDTVIQKKKEQYDKDMKKKPADKEMDF